MTSYWVNKAAVIYKGGYLTIMLIPEMDVAVELRDLLAKINSEGVEGTSREVRQLLSDTEAALNKAFVAKARKTPVQERPQKVCMLPACGCDGLAHP